jgi:hypothetical protein
MAYVTANNFARRPWSPATGPFARPVRLTGTTGKQVIVQRQKDGSLVLAPVKLGEVEKRLLTTTPGAALDPREAVKDFQVKPEPFSAPLWAWIMLVAGAKFLFF